jgi:aminomethyltransferase
MLANTPLHANHLALGAKMVAFFGWDMPLHYGSQLQEHHQVRDDAGMFDVSHMTIVDILGAGGRQFLRKLLTNDIDKLAHTGKAMYTCMCNERGGIIDDLIVYQKASDNYRIVLNSATREKDLKWINQQTEGLAVGLQERKDLAMIAVQGPKAIERTLSILNPTQVDCISTLTPFECIEVGDWFFARTGYTGEDGLEIMVPVKEVNTLWNQLIEAGIKPCGLGARDTLRLEAGLFLYGQDMDETTTPLESSLGWTVAFEPEERAFIGKGALLSQKNLGCNRKVVGLIIREGGIMRHGQRVIVEGFPDGVITSGTYSPTLACSIALARVPVKTQDKVFVDIRGKLIEAEVVKPRFVQKKQ